MNLLLLSTDTGAQRGPSGYIRLLDQFPEAAIEVVRRRDPRNLATRAITALLASRAACTWYRTGSLKLELAAARRARGLPADVVHLLWGDNDWGYLHHLLPSRTAFVVTLHNPPELLPGVFPRPEVLKRVDRFVLMSPDQASFLARHGIDGDRGVFVPHGIDCAAFVPGSRGRARGGKSRILHVGSYLRDFETLAAVTRIMHRDPVVFDIVAPADMRARWEFAANVQWHSGVSPQALVALYQDATALFMTAIHAAANNAILEALACGVPVVAQRVGGLQAYLDGRCAVFVSPSNPAEAVEQLRTLVADEGMQATLSAGARRQALEFDWREVARRMRQVYNDARSEAERRNRA